MFSFLSKGFLTFSPSKEEHDRGVGGDPHAIEDSKMIKDYDSNEENPVVSDDSGDDNEMDKSNDESNDEDKKEEEKHDSTDDEHWEREEGSGGNSSSNSKSSKRTSILTGSDLPQDSPKDDTISKDSSKSSKGSTNRKFSHYRYLLFYACSFYVFSNVYDLFTHHYL